MGGLCSASVRVNEGVGEEDVGVVMLVSIANWRGAV